MGTTVRAEYPGYVMDILVRPGDSVEEEEALILMESTDQDHTPFYVNAPEAGKIKEILLEEGDFADEDDELMVLGDVDSDDDHHG
ncbi:MAG: acetyl-CoA carboxylase biotin carboxyl carrier protein subunit [Acidobacteria bacterium]|nr:acetyl-CoA carboxylase biotin carboxyl carrier protein subunit [Acidobacteriota bacterium]